MKIPIIGTDLDERFFRHRQRSTSIAGLYAYRYFANGVLNWDLLIVVMAMGAVKLALMAWYFTTE
jgi:hypothetical protein